MPVFEACCPTAISRPLSRNPASERVALGTEALRRRVWRRQERWPRGSWLCGMSMRPPLLLGHCDPQALRGGDRAVAVVGGGIDAEHDPVDRPSGTASRAEEEVAGFAAVPRCGGVADSPS